MATTSKQLDINTDKFIDIINKLADTGIKTKEDICNYLKLDIKDFMALIKANNLYYDKSEGMYLPKEKTATTTTVTDIKKVKPKPKDSPKKVTHKAPLDKVTYRIPKTLNDTLKLQCIIEDTTATDIVIKALEQYIPQSTKDTIKKIKK